MKYKDTKKGIKVRHSRAFWQSVIVEQRQSNQSVASFCQAKGLEPVTFYSWRKRLGSEEEQSRGVSFTPIRVSEPTPAGMELLLPGGLILRFSGLAPVDYLCKLSASYAVL